MPRVSASRDGWDDRPKGQTEYTVEVGPLDQDGDTYVTIMVKRDRRLSFEASGVLTTDELNEIIRQLQAKVTGL